MKIGLSAERYAAVRPYVHATALATFQTFAAIHFPVERELDLGCGTRQSTEALLRFADRIVGMDPSGEMLSASRAHPNVEYRQSAAETTRDGDESFDLIAVARAFQRFDQDAFLAEARRVLK